MYTACNNFIINNQRIVQLFGTFLFGLSVGIALVKLLCLFNVIDLNPKKYVYVDIEKVISSVNKTITQQIEVKQITDDQVSTKLGLARTKFGYILDNYAKNHNAIVFSSSKVISGATNETEYFIDKTLEGIK